MIFPLADGLLVQQLSQAGRCRTSKNVTVMLYYSGRSARARTCTSVSTLTPELFQA